MHQQEAPLGIQFEDDAPRTDPAAEQSLMFAAKCGDIAAERVLLYLVERGVDSAVYPASASTGKTVPRP